MKPDVQMTQAEADSYMEQFKQNLGKVLSANKEEVVRAEAAEKKQKASLKRTRTRNPAT